MLDRHHAMRLVTREELRDDCYDTIWAIAASPYVSEFVVGYTHRSRRDRANDYYRAIAYGYQHMVLLSDKMVQDDAHWLEEEIQDLVKKNRDGVACLRKYRSPNLDDVYRRSSGGKKLPPNQRICSIYMAWREDEETEPAPTMPIAP